MGDIALDIAELRTLLQSAEREANRKLLSDAITKAEATVAASSAATEASESAASPPAVVPAPRQTLPVNAPIAITVPAAAAPAATAPAVWFDEPSYGWSEAGEFIEVLVTDERLKGVGTLPKEAVTCDFTETSFDLKILGLGGRNFRVRVPVLDKNIVVSASKVSVGKNRVKVLLKKSGQWDYWSALAAKKPKAATEAAAKSPDGGIMDMMREMYNDGDDQMKKTIAEAWTKSRGAAGGAGGGLGAGLGGGLGGGLDDDL